MLPIRSGRLIVMWMGFLGEEECRNNSTVW